MSRGQACQIHVLIIGQMLTTLGLWFWSPACQMYTGSITASVMQSAVIAPSSCNTSGNWQLYQVESQALNLCHSSLLGLQQASNPCMQLLERKLVLHDNLILMKVMWPAAFVWESCGLQPASHWM